MKKSIIALAVAGALTAPMVAQADATLYGSLRLALNKTDDRKLDMTDNVSRIGIKGSSELFNGNKAIFQFEQAVNTADGGWGSARLSSIGITGDFGTVNFGRMWSPFALWTVLPFHLGENTASIRTAGYTTGLAAGSNTSGYIHRLPQVLAYISPNMNGLQIAAAVAANDSSNDYVFGQTTATPAASTDTDNVDIAHVAAKYTSGGLFVSASWVDVEALDEQHVSLGATYTMDNVKVGARYGTTDNGGSAADTDQWSVVGQYTMGNTKFQAAYTDDENLTGGQEVWSLEVQQQLGKQARAFAAIINDNTNYDGDAIEVGYRVDF